MPHCQVFAEYIPSRDIQGPHKHANEVLPLYRWTVKFRFGLSSPACTDKLHIGSLPEAKRAAHGSKCLPLLITRGHKASM